MIRNGEQQQEHVQTTGRLRSLDGLRGVAALVVLIHHSLLVVPSLAVVYFGGRRPATGSGAWWMAYTPLHLLWAGREAVYVFFVLSGLVLALPFMGGRSPAWRVYYPRRIVRLYLPVFAAVALGTLIATATPRDPQHAASLWLQHRPAGATPLGILHDLTLVGGTSDLISPLWSLQWEVIFSLLLPIYIWAVVRWPRLFWVKMAGVFAVVTAGAFVSATALYLPMFAVGVLLAARLDWFRAVATRITRPGWAALTVAALLLVVSHWLAAAAHVPDRLIPATAPAILLGSTLLILVAAFCPAARAVLQKRTAQWLGRISFSLYLIHEPIVIALGYTVGRHHAWAVLPLTLAIALPLAAVFFRFVEAPAHDLARRAGQRWIKAPPGELAPTT